MNVDFEFEVYLTLNVQYSNQVMINHVKFNISMYRCFYILFFFFSLL